MERNLNSIATSIKEAGASAAEGLALSLKVNRNLIAAALVIACGTDEGERCAPPSGIILMDPPIHTEESGNTGDLETATVPGETNETAETKLHSGTTLLTHSATSHSAHSATENHSGTPFIDSDGDNFSDDYEQTRGTNPNNPLSRPSLDMEVMALNSLVGFQDRNQPTWTTAAPLPLPYTAEQSLRVHPSSPAFIEVESYGGESVVGLRFNTDEYRDNPQDSLLLDCGYQAAPWDPTSQVCQVSANVSRVQDPTSLGQWGVLAPSYDPSDFTQWYRVLDPTGAAQEFPAMELRLP